MADGFCSEMAPRSRNGQRGNWTCTVAPWVGGSRAAPSGSRNTTRWLIVEGEGRWKMNCVSETAWMLVWTAPGVWLAGEGRGEGEGGRGVTCAPGTYSSKHGGSGRGIGGGGLLDVGGGLALYRWWGWRARATSLCE